MRGSPARGFTVRIIMIGRNVRPKFGKRGAKSQTSMAPPRVSRSTVRRIAVFWS